MLTAAVATSAKPARSRRVRSSSGCRPCHQDAVAQPSALTVSGAPACTGVSPCTTVRVSGTSASTPKNDPARMPRNATTAGTPRRTATVPRGSSRRSPNTSSPTPATAPGTLAHDGRWPAYCTSAMPLAAASANGHRAGTLLPCSARASTPPRPGGILRSSNRTPTTTNGAIPTKTSRQDRCWATSPATTGPTSAGSTQAAETWANNLGRYRTAYRSPITTYTATMTRPEPKPCTARPSTNTAIAGAAPATSRPAANVASPASSGSRAPRRSATPPEVTIPTTLATRNAVNDQPYEARPRSSRTAVGSAVATAIASNAISVTTRTSPTVVPRSSRGSPLRRTAGALPVTTSPYVRVPAAAPAAGPRVRRSEQASTEEHDGGRGSCDLGQRCRPCRQPSLLADGNLHGATRTPGVYVMERA